MTDAVPTTTIGAIVGVLTAIVLIVGNAVRVTAKLGEIKEELTKRMNQDAAELREQLTEEHDAVMKQFGDSLAAMREKIRDTELWNRDNFVRRIDFDRAVDAMTTRMDAGFAKIESKIDKLQGRT